jgi:dinuclear metal center YbgI/SA1388 family protein
MTIGDFERWLERRLAMRQADRADSSLNGLQVGDRDAPVSRVAFAVDACLESVARAAERGADALFVHHGLFWGKPAALTGPMYGRIKALLDAKMALFACHLPLDLHPELGNNAALAKALGIEAPEPFGEYHGALIGFSGALSEPLTVEEAIRRVLPEGGPPAATLAFGKARSRTAAVVSGGAAQELEQAVEAGIDLYVTGECSHSVYHLAMEAGVNMIAAGHYATETWGVRAVSEAVARELGLEAFFVDVPTGL